MCADLLLLTESARSAVWNAAWALQENLDANRAVAVAKVYVSDAVRKAGNLAVQSHGGIGFTWEHDLHLYYKRAKADEYLFGDATFHRERLAEMILG
jgi:alkylation response protein AidB-like acyl-CoA dehydrogenase